MFKQKNKPAEPATEPGAVFQAASPEYSVIEHTEAHMQPEYTVIEPTEALEAYVVTDDGNAVELSTHNLKADGQSITDEESGSESGHGAADLDGKKLYCGNRLSLTALILCVIAGLLVVALPIALIKKNDAFTRSNGQTVSGQCRAPRCFTDNDCSFFGPDLEADNGNGTNAPTAPWQCNRAVLRCANERNLMADFCSCFRDSDCISGRCEGFSIGFSTCTPLLENNAYCNEASDCLSNRCDRPEPGKAPVCMEKIGEVCGACNEHTDCMSGECNYLVGRCANDDLVLEPEVVEVVQVETDVNGTSNATNITETMMPTLAPVIDDAGCSCLSTSDCMPQNRCEFGGSNGGRICVEKAASCGGCNENSDCMSNNCHIGLFRCRGDDGFMDDKCNCLTNRDCSSSRCEALSLNPLDGFFCFPKNAECKQCNEDSDCETGKCNLLNLMCGDDQGNILDCWF